MKYIIDVPEEIAKISEEFLSKAGLLCEPYTEPDLNPLVDEAVEAIENEVWEFASSIICPSDCGIKDSIHKDCKEIFGLDSWELRGIFTNYTYQEAKDKHEAWLKQKDQIRIGDELKDDENIRAVVLDIMDEDYVSYEVFTENGIVDEWQNGIVVKTGRHFPEVVQLLVKMREDTDD